MGLQAAGRGGRRGSMEWGRGEVNGEGEGEGGRGGGGGGGRVWTFLAMSTAV